MRLRCVNTDDNKLYNNILKKERTPKSGKKWNKHDIKAIQKKSLIRILLLYIAHSKIFLKKRCLKEKAGHFSIILAAK